MAPNNLIPITVLSGFLGAGKTTTLTHVLTNVQGLKVAVIVNDMADVNIDAQLVEMGKRSAKAPKVITTKENLVALSNGCICCSLREDLLDEVAKLARKKKFDYILIESSGISEPMHVAETFEYAMEAGLKKICDTSRLDTLVTVVDAMNFIRDFTSSQHLADKEEWKAAGQQDGVTGQDKRKVVELLISQIEFANVILLNKIDLVRDEKELAFIQSIIKQLNPDAKVITTTNGVVDPREILNTNLMDFEQASLKRGWGELTDVIMHGISSFVYSRRRPFHPARLDRLLSETFGSPQQEQDEQDSANSNNNNNNRRLNNAFKDVIRSKGFFWLCTRMESFGYWSHCGESFELQYGGTFWSALPREEWPQGDPDLVASIEKKIAEGGKYGDRKQEIVFIGMNLDQCAISMLLDECLLTDEEMALGEEAWSNFEDPIDLHGGDEEVDEMDDYDHEGEHDHDHYHHHHAHKHH